MNLFAALPLLVIAHGVHAAVHVQKHQMRLVEAHFGNVVFVHDFAGFEDHFGSGE